VVRERYSQEIQRFVVTGASKRGWTTWLTAAVDPRVCAIAPRVIDVLNFSKQMPHQVLSFGTYSEMIGDYTRRNLPQQLARPEARALLSLVDPYSFRKNLNMPKLILLGTNDRYWPVDAVKLYFWDLPGEKYIHYVPNAGHGLGAGAFEVIAAFYQTVVAGEARPRFRWSFRVEGEKALLSIEARDTPEKAELWTARASTRDFRDSRWSPEELEVTSGAPLKGTVNVPEKGFAALFGSLTYRSSLGHLYTLCTNVEVIGEKPPAVK
jgi:PhoPQ-activated pathogenicity-related protein